MSGIIVFLLIISMIFNFSSIAQNNYNKIGNISDYETFQTEMSKRINFDDYNLSVESQESTYDYTYTLIGEDELLDSDSNFDLTIENDEFTLPTLLSDMLYAGWEITQVNFSPVYEADLEAYYSSASVILKNKDYKTLDVFVISPFKDSAVKIQDCIVKQVNCSYYTAGSYKDSSVADVTFFGDITDDSSLDDIIASLGNPENIHYMCCYYNGQATLSILQLTYRFSDRAGTEGSVCITISPQQDETEDAVNCIENISYLVDYYY